MNKDNCVAYQGDKFIIEWFYDDRGYSQSFEYYDSLSNAQKRKLLMLFNRIGEFGIINDKTKFRYEGEDIFSFKPQPDRFFSFFVKGNKIIVAHAFRKKSDKSPPNEKIKAIENQKSYFRRNKEGKYYE
jgi:phage-related protein